MVVANHQLAAAFRHRNTSALQDYLEPTETILEVFLYLLHGETLAFLPFVKRNLPKNDEQSHHENRGTILIQNIFRTTWT